jgi:hypothetical protein
MAVLAENKARNCVVPIHEHAATAESPRALLDGQLRFLKRRRLELDNRAIERELAEQDRQPASTTGSATGDDARTSELSRQLQKNHAELRELQAH